MRLKQTVFTLGTIVVCLIVYAIWQGDTGTTPKGVSRPSALPEAAGNSEPDATPSARKVDGRFSFANVPPLRDVTSRDELMTRYTPDQAKTIDAFYRSYARGLDFGSDHVFRDIFWFTNEAQLTWLLSQGFPTPDEILAGQAMSEDDLEKAAEDGNFKAAAFYLDRMTERPDAFAGGVLTGKGTLFEDRLLREGTAFGAYVLAKNAERAGNIDGVLAAYQFAKLLGDDRAYQFAQTLRNKPSSSTAALSAFHTLLNRAARANPQSANIAVLAQRPRIPPP